jgi:ATP-binding cassette subfamily B protein
MKGSIKTLLPLLKTEKGFIFVAFLALLTSSVCSMLGPYYTGFTIDHFVTVNNLSGLQYYACVLLSIYIVVFIANVIQIRFMGGVGQRLLFKLRNMIFEKLEELPLSFFTQNKAGDLISRINNDTEKLSQFFSETLTRLLGIIFIIGGVVVFLISLHPKLGLATLAPAIVLWFLSQFISSWIRKANDESLKSAGLLSAEVQESIQNFKVIVSFNRRDYFRNRFEEINKSNYISNMKAGILNGVYTPVYDFAANLGQYAVLVYGIYLIASGSVTIGIIVSFLAYAEKFYNPLRQMAQLWATFQISLSAWSRISNILSLSSDMKVIEECMTSEKKVLLEFKNVSFHYDSEEEKKDILHEVSFELEEGKTYALVGPTGGGKTTTASLMARLFDPSTGTIFLKGKDIRSIDAKERTSSIGFILQDPIIFGGTLRDNIVYGNEEYESLSAAELHSVLVEKGLESLLSRFEGGLDTPLPKNIDSMSLGQKQILAFVRAVLRNPDLLILDEATANIDTVTEQELEKILEKLPQKTTKVIIAHRLNTIQNADVIYFVNGSAVTKAGSMEDAVNMLLKGKKKS